MQTVSPGSERRRSMKKALIFIIIIIIILGVAFYFLFFKKEKESIPAEEITNMSKLNNIKIAMIVASKDFRDE